MKKMFFLLILFLAVSVTVNAQCIPDGTCAMLVCPDTNVNLPHAVPNVSYTTTMTVRIPSDTTVSTYLIEVDSLVYNSTSGLPTGFTATPDLPKWDGGTKGCLLIQGIAADSMQGKTYNLSITTTVYGKYMGTIPLNFPVPLDGYKIQVDSSSGIANFYMDKFTVEQNTPNPFSKTTTIVFNSPNSEIIYFTVLNVIGEKVFEKNINASSGENIIEFSASDLTSGIYLYKLGNKTSTITKRMILEK